MKKKMSADPRIEQLTPLQRAFLALEQAEGRLAAVTQAGREPIAVVGLGCRVPGGGKDAASFWQLMANGIDAIGPVPPERWDHDKFFDPDPTAIGRISTRSGGFLRDVDQFDPGFFGIAPREAEGMDPQQRLLLEVCWEALENAGQAPDRLENSPTGVFFGVCGSDYAYSQLKSKDLGLLDAHFASGIAHSVFSGRLSFLLGLRGPSITIDTACSSSLVAVHLACQALRNSECRMALAGGVNLILAPEIFMALSQSRMLSPDGRCKSFSAAADGFGRGEGCGVVVLKRLSDARADGDRVLAVITGSAVNQDGPSSSLTAPNGPAQEAVIRAALAFAGTAPGQVGFIEAHGTGTQLGDPLEVRALGAVFAENRSKAHPLLIGSVKTNIGHLEAAAGVTGLIKVILALHHRTIPPHLHFGNPSPHIAWDDLPVRVPVHLVPWEPIGGRRIGGVSSFGFSGTNAHVVLEEAPQPLADADVSARPYLLAISAHDHKALGELAGRYATFLASRPDVTLANVCHTANIGRAHFRHRATVIASTIGEARQELAALARGEPGRATRLAEVIRREPLRIAFLFTGQGSQYPGMAKGLYETSLVFREALDRCAVLLVPHLDRPLLELLFPADPASSLLDETVYTQPALFALEYALAELWRSWGVEPNILIGHSVGEYVAACIAGVFTLEDGLALIALRGRLMQSLPPGGAMAAIFAPYEIVAAAVAPHASSVSIASVNGPAQTVISGSAAAVAQICTKFGAGDVHYKALPVSHAFHSPLVEPVLDRFEAAVSTIRLSPPKLRLVSNLTGKSTNGLEITRPSYWRRHMREAVRFGEGVRALETAQVDCCIEIGPTPALLPIAAAAFATVPSTMVPSLRRSRPDWDQMMEGLSAIYLAGHRVDWRGVSDHGQHRIVDLPSYPFQRQRYWFRENQKSAAVPMLRRPGAHPLLGQAIRSPSRQKAYQSVVAADWPSFVRQHRVSDRIVLPATAYLEILGASARAEFQTDTFVADNVTIGEAMLFEEDGSGRLVHTSFEHSDGEHVSISISSAAEQDETGVWVEHATAQLRRGMEVTSPLTTLDHLRAACPTPVPVDQFYLQLDAIGLSFGNAFRTVDALWRGTAQALGHISLSQEFAAETDDYRFHPVLLDGCLQVVAATMIDEPEPALYLPIGVGSVAWHRQPGRSCWSHIALAPATGEVRRAHFTIFDADGRPVAELIDVLFQRIAGDALDRLDKRWLDDSLYEIAWRPAPVAASSPQSRWSIPALIDAATSQLARLRAESRIDIYDTGCRQIDELCEAYILRALRELGWIPAPGDIVETSALAKQLGIAPRHQRLFVRLLAILADAGWLVRHPAGWRVNRSFEVTRPADDLVLLMRSLPDAAAELEIIGRVGGELAGALSGERNPIELLFPDGSLDTAERLYRDSPTARLFNGLMNEVISAVVSTRVDKHALRILEIGAGTGGTTAHLLPCLPETGVDYTFTDVGPAFVARARDRFRDHSFMRFEVLDLERDLEAQGFAARQFDVVVASNVIHATADLRKTLARVRRLLTPGGLFAMLEVTTPQRSFDLTVGLTEGWWAFSDTELRKDYALVSRNQWLQLLPECGFDSVATLPCESASHGSLAGQSLFLALAGADTQTHGSRDWLLFADESGVAAKVAEQLRATGDRCTLVRRGGYDFDVELSHIKAANSADYHRLLTDLREAGRTVQGVIYGWTLDTAAWDGMTEQQFVDSCTLCGTGPVLLAKALVAESSPPRIWVVTRGAQAASKAVRGTSPSQAAAWGVTRTLALEHPEVSCVALDLDPSADRQEINQILAELAEDGIERQIAFRSGHRNVARLARPRRSRLVPSAAEAGWRYVAALPGSFDQFERRPIERRPLAFDEVEIAVEATGLNFYDLLNVLGVQPGVDDTLGGECAGRITGIGAGITHVGLGDPVLAVAPSCLASFAVAKGHMVQRRPVDMSAEEGAAFPIAFLTAEFCLTYTAKMQSGDRVLIHAAAGGVGMAAVQLARRAGAEVFATAGSESKRALLRSIGVQHVFDSRTGHFAEEILARTGGRGVDIVLNSLAGDLIEPSFRALAAGGRFVEIGKRGIKSSEWVNGLGRDLHYFVVDWWPLMAAEPKLVGDMLARLVDATRVADLAPLPRQIFDIADSSRAFRLMAHAQHVGKVVVRQGASTPPKISRQGSYLVTGGLSGLGLLVARWLAESGAGRLILIGRRGMTPEAAPVIESLRASGTNVVVKAVDVSDEAALRELLSHIRGGGPPLRGILHLAGVLENAALRQQGEDRFTRVFAPKVRGAWLLDRLTRGDPIDLFVMFSSIAAVLGAAGQSNHAAANAVLDLLAHERRERGLHGLSINWGAWADAGAAADQDIRDRLAAQGIGAMTPAQGIQALESLLRDESAQLAVLPVEWRRFTDSSEQRGLSSLLAEIIGSPIRSTRAPTADQIHRPNFRETLAAAPASRRRRLVESFVRDHALRTLGMDPAATMLTTTPLGELGLDSLLVVELRNKLGLALGVPLPVTLLLDYPTLDALTEYLLAEVLTSGTPNSGEPEDIEIRHPQLRDDEELSSIRFIEELSDNEVDRLLAMDERLKVRN
jgi:acyl transferase domain-containing protein/NADPH:quinone reductase-like Zn-dependent oxidoreductase/ubiquinone/menaquinone biosynthesis C-methylase UbiE/NADP-dependent 3-hydroxy acid dehydrogenase YdfG/acyl carrier protein